MDIAWAHTLTCAGFSPQTVFRTVYQPACHTALWRVFSTDAFATHLCRRIESDFASFFQFMRSNSQTSSQVHRYNLGKQARYWAGVQSNKTCLYCLRRCPEHPPGCGHAVCDICVQVFGERHLDAEHQYALQCIMCEDPQPLTVRLKPPTAAVRVLSIDGGGTRGIIPLEILVLLQELVGDDLPLQDMFDLALGTSSGGLIVLTMCALRLGVLACKERFESFATRCLSAAQRNRFLKFWMSDGIYDTTVVEDCMKEHYGLTRRMFDAPVGLVSGYKFAVTASSIKDGTPFLFANYNGTASHRADICMVHSSPTKGLSRLICPF
jgi:hypothetical protein